MVSVLQPMHLDQRREFVAGDFSKRTERVAGSLADERGSTQSRKVRRPRAIGAGRRMKRISEAHEPLRAAAVRDEAGDPSAHRLSADDQGPSGETGDHVGPARAEDVLRIGRALPAGGCSFAHIGELEPADGYSPRREPLREGFHELRAHSRARAVRQDQHPVSSGRRMREDKLRPIAGHRSSVPPARPKPAAVKQPLTILP